MNNFSQSSSAKDDSKFHIGGVFHVDCINADGKLKWSNQAKNAVVNGGLDSILNLYFRNGTNLAAWAIGLISGAGPTLDASDTHSSHAGWTEFTTYSESVRQQWAPNATATQQLVNPALLEYNITTAGTISGTFIVGGSLGGGVSDADTKGSTNATPILWAHALFDNGDQSVSIGDTLRVTYTVGAASA